MLWNMVPVSEDFMLPRRSPKGNKKSPPYRNVVLRPNSGRQRSKSQRTFLIYLCPCGAVKCAVIFVHGTAHRKSVLFVRPKRNDLSVSSDKSNSLSYQNFSLLIACLLIIDFCNFVTVICLYLRAVLVLKLWLSAWEMPWMNAEYCASMIQRWKYRLF